MKKSLAITGASVLGIGMAAVGTVPANAADVTTACTSPLEHMITIGTLNDNWFMDCVPQYGLGKVEFTATSTDPFPADFTALNDPSVSSTYTGDAMGAAAYFAASGEPAGFVSLSEGTTAVNSREYSGQMMFPIAGVQSILSSELPSACDAGTITYGNAYRIDYAAATTTFTQMAGGETWVYEVSVAPQPVYLGLNFSPADPGNPVAGTADGELDRDAAQCAIYSDNDVVIPAGTDGTPVTTLEAMLTRTSLSNGATTLSPFGFATNTDIGEFPRWAAAPDEPALAATGVDLLPGALTGGAGILAGLGLFFFGRRRKRSTI